jgi:hypothetical protein
MATSRNLDEKQSSRLYEKFFICKPNLRLAMGSISRGFSILLAVILAVSSLIMIESASAQSIPKPSVPEFTAKYVDRSYTVPASTTIDQYTGQNVTNPSYYVENRTLEIAIRNQPFTPYVDSSTGAQWKITLMYQIRTKGHFAQNWINIYSVDNGFLRTSNSDYTTVAYPLGEGSPWGNLQANAQVDFQVQALIGYVHRISNITAGNQLPSEMFPWVFDGQTSEWSPTQAVTIPTSNISPNPTVTPSPTPTVPEFSWLVIVPLLLTMFSIAVIVKHRKNRPSII